MRPAWVDQIETALSQPIPYSTPFTFEIDDFGDMGAYVFFTFTHKPNMSKVKHKINRVLKPIGFYIRWWDRFEGNFIKCSIDRIDWKSPSNRDTK